MGCKLVILHVLCTECIPCSVGEAFAWLAVGVIVISVSTNGAIICSSEAFSTLAFSRRRLTVTGVSVILVTLASWKK